MEFQARPEETALKFDQSHHAAIPLDQRELQACRCDEGFLALSIQFVAADDRIPAGQT